VLCELCEIHSFSLVLSFIIISAISAARNKKAGVTKTARLFSSVYIFFNSYASPPPRAFFVPMDAAPPPVNGFR
jgi:hypothetical protein